MDELVEQRVQEALDLLRSMTVILGHTLHTGGNTTECMTCGHTAYSERINKRVMGGIGILLNYAVMVPCGENHNVIDEDYVRLASRLNEQFQLDVFV